ncbi:ABC transporter substrate-binding protein [Pokkaliibacter sp. MBI-7]|uniref:Transcriptional regulator n=1 Tax=Proteobacteria bacterium 228 TaxID=2083153 RepID=A0A2S5KQJ5_9PROT|nr:MULTISPECIES: ABC transporter substrate-binding protein [Pokkaliibacter]MDH2435655.1 ABC transporter substrate-binding protein [Pokkaliibacter sp. MBI-7]PPC77000.1 transcriptional regulator [Pokkaliibacter plantistimulans]
MKKMLKTSVAAVFAASLGITAAQATELKSIGLSVSDLGNPFFVQIAKGAEKKAKELGGDNVKVTVVSSAYDLQRQVSQIDDFIAKKVDLILISAADPKGIAPAVMRAKAAGIKVLAVDVAAEGADATITTNNVQAGDIACEFLAKQMEYKGDVVIINGPPVSAVVDRVEGCKNVLSKYPDIKLLSDKQNAGGSREGGLEKMTSLLTAYPKLKGVFAINDPTAIGAELAAKQARRSDFIITSVDGAPVAQEDLKKPESMLVATAAQFPNLMAEKAVEVGYGMLNGTMPDQQVILIPAELVNKDNVKDYRGW